MKNGMLKRDGDLQIFIVGMARSGTTLLSEILNSHSKIAVSPETHYFRNYWLKDTQTSLKMRGKLSENFLASAGFKQFGFPIEEKKEIEYEISESLKTGQTEILSNIMTHYRLKEKKPFWAEKTTAHLMYIPEIARLFPACKFICITRDPRDICLSLKKASFHTGTTTLSIARRWKKYTTRTSLYKNTYKDNFLEIKYEELIVNTEQIIKKICMFLGIDYEKNMLIRNGVPTTFDKDKEYWKMNASRPIDRNNFGKWKKEMDVGEIYFFQKFLSKEIDFYNYEKLLIENNFHIKLEMLKIIGNWCLTTALNLSRQILDKGKYSMHIN
ncbi:sulfotransferase [Thermodesulfobacteriota bacterium]